MVVEFLSPSGVISQIVGQSDLCNNCPCVSKRPFGVPAKQSRTDNAEHRLNKKVMSTCETG